MSYIALKSPIMAHEGLSRFVYIYGGVDFVARLEPLLHSPAFFYYAVKLDLRQQYGVTHM